MIGESTQATFSSESATETPIFELEWPELSYQRKKKEKDGSVLRKLIAFFFISTFH